MLSVIQWSWLKPISGSFTNSANARAFFAEVGPLKITVEPLSEITGVVGKSMLPSVLQAESSNNAAKKRHRGKQVIFIHVPLHQIMTAKILLALSMTCLR
jgi:hypothetical protein